MDRIIRMLTENPGVNAWKIRVTERKSRELFFVLKELETNRATNTKETEVTLYTDKDGKRGSAAFSYESWMTDEAVAALIQEKLYAASFAMNEWYDLPGKEEAVIPESTSNLKDRSFGEIIEEVEQAVFAADVYEKGYLSATEFFLYENHERILNSNGVDLAATTYSGMIELIPSWEDHGEEVELYHQIHFSDVDPAALTKEVEEQLSEAKARNEAVKLPEVPGVKVLLQGQECASLFWAFADELNYRSKYEQANRFEVGDNIQGERVTGTTMTMQLVPTYENAMASRPFDGDGVVLKPLSLVENGIAKALFGPSRFGCYLKEEHPAGTLPVLVVKEGAKTFEEMARQPYLRCVSFSGLQVDVNAGFFGGEVRLGYYFDGEKEIPVTGFSISGNLEEARGTMIYSKETITTRSYHGPKTLEIRNMQIM